MENDRELLEWAAKAAGIPLIDLYDSIGDHGEVETPGWNPLTDDGDCARLEAECGIGTAWTDISVYVSRRSNPTHGVLALFEEHNNDKNAARRYASTYLAAQIGKEMNRG